MMTRPRLAALTFAALVGFACNSLLCRAALRSGAIDPVSFTAVRLFSGAVVLGLLARRSPWHERDPLSALALFAYALPFSLAYVRLDAGMGALLLFGSVQTSMLGWSWFKGDRLPAQVWLGTGLAFTGLVALVAPGLTAPPPLDAALMLGAGLAWGAYTLRGRGTSTPVATNASNFALACAPALVALAIASSFSGVQVSGTGLLLALVSGAVASALGYSLWYVALPHLARAEAAVVQLLVPPLAAIGGVAVLSETVSLRIAAWGTLILGGVALATLRRASPAAEVAVAAARKAGWKN